MWELDCEESWELKNWFFWTVVLEKTLESPLDYKEIQPVHPKGDQSWVVIGKTDAEAETQYFGHLMLEELTHWERPWCWEGLGAGGEGDDRGWDGWMASPTWCTWVWVNYGSWWWTGRPGMLQFMGSQRRTQLSNWTELKEPSGFTEYLEISWARGSLTCSLRVFTFGPSLNLVPSSAPSCILEIPSVNLA